MKWLPGEMKQMWVAGICGEFVKMPAETAMGWIKMLGSGYGLGMWETAARGNGTNVGGRYLG